MGKGVYHSLSDLLNQGYLIARADDAAVAANQPWAFPQNLRDEFNQAFAEFRARQQECEDARNKKEEAVKFAGIARDKAEKSLTQLKQFIRAVADKDTAAQMLHTLGLDGDIPNKNADFVTLLMGTVLPHLNDWDGTPLQIADDVKALVKDEAQEFADAVVSAEEGIAESTTATQIRDEARRRYEEILTRIRNWLYLRLPEGRYDSRLDEYGFEVWDKPPAHKLHPPGGFAYEPKDKKFVWKSVAAADGYQVQISTDGGENWKPLEETTEPELTISLPNAVVWARIRAYKQEPFDVSSWADVIRIDARVPEAPKNLRWSIAEHEGVEMALLEWDPAERAETYEMEFDPVGRDGDIFELGDVLSVWQPVLDTVGTYRYRIRGKNAFGVGPWSNQIEITVE